MDPRSISTDVAVDVVAWIDPPIFLAEDLAGSSHQVRIGERDAILTLPLEGAQIIDRPGPDPVLREPSFPPPPVAIGNSSGLASSRMALGTPKGILALDAVRLGFSDPAVAGELSKREGARDLSTALGQWLAVVRDWLSAWTGSLRDMPAPAPGPAVRVALLADPNAPPQRAGGIRTLVAMPIRGATGWPLEAAFEAASTSRGLPLQHTLFESARVHHSRDEYREAVIESCSAVEIALSEVVTKKMDAAGHSGAEIRKLLGGVRGVVDLYRMVAAGSGPLEVSIGAVMDRLANPRNGAVHSGLRLDREASTRAIETASRLVALTPLPTPDEIMGREDDPDRSDNPQGPGEATAAADPIIEGRGAA